MESSFIFLSLNKSNNTKEKISDLGIKLSNVKLLKAGTTLLSFKLSIGKTSIAGKDLYTNEAIAGLEIKKDLTDKVLDKYLFDLFTYGPFNLADGVMGKVFGKSLNSEYLKNIKIPLPPKDIQEKIVNEIGEIEKREKELKENIENLEKNIEEIIENVDGEEMKLIKCINFINGYAFSSNDLYSTKKGNNYLEVLKIGNININGSLNNKFQFTKYNERLNNFLIEKNDILIAMTGATVGKVAISDKDNLILNQRVGKIVPLNINRKYLFRILLSKSFYNYCQNTAHGNAQGNISGNKILEYKIKIPKNLDSIVKKIEIIEGKISDGKRELVILDKSKNDILVKYL